LTPDVGHHCWMTPGCIRLPTSSSGLHIHPPPPRCPQPLRLSLPHKASWSDLTSTPQALLSTP
jgi:hypothetical protein